MANNDKENKIEKFTKEAIGKTLNQFNKEIGMTDLVEVNKNQDRILNGILSQVNDESTEKTEKSNIITLDNSTDGIVELKEIQGDTNVNVSKIEEMPITHDIGDKEGNVFTLNEIPKGAISIGEIQGNTMVNCNKDDEKELVLMTDLSTQGDNNITLTEGVDGGKVDVALEGNTLVNVSKTKDNYITHESDEDTTGNHIALVDEGYIRPVLNGKTMVNVCDQKDPIAVTKSYTVENSGNHVVLQGDIDGSCRPNIYGNTLVNLSQINKATLTTNKNLSTDLSMIKPSTTYTRIVIVEKNTLSPGNSAGMVASITNISADERKIDLGFTGVIQFTFTTPSDLSGYSVCEQIRAYAISTEGELVIKDMLLEGDYTDKPIPDYFEGLQSTFEDNLVTQEMVDSGEEVADNLGKYRVDYKVTGKNKLYYIGDGVKDGIYIPSNVNVTCKIENDGSFTLNGTLTNSYNDVYVMGMWGSDKVYLNKGVYTLSVNQNNSPNKFEIYLLNKTSDIGNLNTNEGYSKTINCGLGITAVLLRLYPGTYDNVNFKIQIEEGTGATSYEPYKEYTKTVYLNSPLLEGDTIEQQNNNIVHVHRYSKVVLDGGTSPWGNTWWESTSNTTDTVFSGGLSSAPYEDISYCDKLPIVAPSNLSSYDTAITIDGESIIRINIPKELLSRNKDLSAFRTWLNANPITFVGKLKTPQYEVISTNDELLVDSYVNGHLDFESAVPIDKVLFRYAFLEMKYLYSNTQYIIQFEADNDGVIGIILGGKGWEDKGNVIRGINKFLYTTNSNPNTYMGIQGIGFNASNIVVTPAIEQDFGYFSGLSSTFEDSLVTDESDENYGKYKVEYKVTGKNKFKLKDTPILERSDSGLQISLGSGGVVVNGIATTKWNFLQIGSIKTSEKNKTYTLKYSQNKVSSTWHGFVGHAYLNGKKVKDKAISYLDKGDKYGDFKFTITTPNNLDFDEIVLSYTISWDGNLPYTYDNFILSNIQIEEGSVATSYEPYKGHTKTLYLNSPLLEGDTIEEKDGGIYHVHRSGEVVLDGSDDENIELNSNDETSDGTNTQFIYYYHKELYGLNSTVYCNILPGVYDKYSIGIKSITDKHSLSIYIRVPNSKASTLSEFKQWLSVNNLIFVTKLLEPQYELIEQSNLAIPSYANGHLDLASAVPVSKVNFLHFEEELTYLYPATSYTVQFISDKAITIDIALGGTQLLAQNIVKGLNRIIITTPETLVDNKLIIDGVGAKISKVVVTDTDREFKYFEGMKSVGECEELAITSANSDNTLSSTQQLTHEPLRAVGDVKDRYVLIDGKWYIERKCKEVVFDGSDDENWSVTGGGGSDTRNTFECVVENAKYINGTVSTPAMSNIVKYEAIRQIPVEDNCFRLAVSSSYFGYLLFTPSVDIIPYRDLRSWKAYLSNNPVVITYPLQTPVYEPLDYNPIEVYSEVTHITTNSAIPTNITIKNHGFNCLLKPSTTYTISSNLGINTVTTGADIGDSCLRFYDEDTSDKTTMKDVLILEGDWTSKADLIPANFSGIESCFEQALVTDENDVNYGKYRVTAKVVGKNLFDINDTKNILIGQALAMHNGTYNDPNYNTIKNVPVTPGKTYSFSNIDWSWGLDKNKKKINNIGALSRYTIPHNCYYLNLTYLAENQNTIQLEEGDTATAYEPYKESNVTFYLNEPLRGVGDSKDRIFIQDDKVVVERKCGSATFDGSADEYWEKEEARFSISISNVIPNRFSKAINNALFTTDSLVTDDQYDSYAIINGWGGTNKLYLRDINKFTTLAELKQYLQQNPVTVVYQLAEPIYEEVEYSSNRLILDTFNNESFNNSTLFLDTNISPKLSFKPLYEELVYVKNSTKYYIQFNAVGSGEVVINLGGTELTTEIVEGYNCIPITTPSESTNLMVIRGQGITISEVVVSEVVCGGYYKGLQSCFEEHMENGKYRVLLRGIALDGSKVNGIKLYINEPLRGIGDVKDRLCIKNGKLMVERKCGEAIFDGSNYIQSMDTSIDTKKRWLIYQDSSIKDVSDSQVTTINDKYCDISANDTWYNKEGISQNSMQHAIHIYLERYSDGSDKSKQALISELQQNPVTVVYQLAEPTYEEVTNEYGLPIVFEGYENGIVYIDSAVTPTTHIKYTSNNQLATTLSEAEEQNIATQEDINMNVITYMMDIDMILTDMEMSNDISVMAVRRDSSNENMLDRMSDEDKKVYRDNTVVMLEKMITAKVLDKEDIEGRIDMYYDKNRISKEQYKYLKSLL